MLFDAWINDFALEFMADTTRNIKIHSRILYFKLVFSFYPWLSGRKRPIASIDRGQRSSADWNFKRSTYWCLPFQLCSCHLSVNNVLVALIFFWRFSDLTVWTVFENWIGNAISKESRNRGTKFRFWSHFRYQSFLWLGRGEVITGR